MAAIVLAHFTFNGTYDLADGKCEWVKQYVSAHGVDYHGFNEGKGIWGTWDFHSQDSTSPVDSTSGQMAWPIQRNLSWKKKPIRRSKSIPRPRNRTRARLTSCQLIGEWEKKRGLPASLRLALFAVRRYSRLA